MSTPVPRISVVMPVFNAAPYLVQTIESVLNQSFRDFEFLIHDDGSNDSSWDILSAYAERDSRISLSRSENRGIPVTLNALMSRAQGELIARMDADDVCFPHRFEKQALCFDDDPALTALGGAGLLIDASDRPIMVNPPPLDHKDIDEFNLSGRTSFLQSSIMMRHAAYLAAGGYDNKYPVAEDQDLWLRMAEFGKLKNLPDILMKIRIHENSISATQRDLQREMSLKACQAAWSRRGVSSSFMYNDWRPDNTLESRLRFYSWQAWSSGYRSTWRHYALKALRLAPTSKDAWKCLFWSNSQTRLF